MTLLNLLVYIPLQILFIPLAILGAILVGFRQLVVSKRLGISQTAIEVLNGSWTMHIFGIRVDEACDKLTKVLPNTSVTGLWLTRARQGPARFPEARYPLIREATARKCTRRCKDY